MKNIATLFLVAFALVISASAQSTKVSPNDLKPLEGEQWVGNLTYLDYKSKKPRNVHLIAVGRTGVAALHAAALNPDLFTTVTLQDTPRSWSAMAGSVEGAKWLTTTVHDVLRTYDLPDLMQTLPSGKLKIKP